MAKKYTGNFTTEASKVIKNSEHLICKVTEDGTIYLTSGYFLFRMNPLEYAAVAQPVTHCEAGNWTLDQNGKHDGGDYTPEKIFSDAVAATEQAAALERCPLRVSGNKPNLMQSSYYSSEQGFAAFYNSSFVAALAPGATLKAASAISPAVAYYGDEAAALIMPVRPDPKASRAVKAYFTEADDELLQAQNEIAALRGQLAQQADELAALRDSLQAAHNTPEDNKPEPKTAAELIAARWAEVDGLTATIKGARTAAPVVWLAGDAQKHAKAIEAEGGKWSNKKSAYYFRVA